jgi:membrane protease YdiL (CAAX protease family)
MNKKKNISYEIWRIIYPIIIYFGISIIVTVGYMIVEGVKQAAEGMLDPIELGEIITQNTMEKALLITIISSVVSLLVIVPLYFGDKRKEKISGEFIKYNNAPVGKWILVVILGFSSCVSLNILINITGLAELSSGFEAVNEAIYGSSLFIQILATVIMAPLCEEFLVRGLIYKRMTRWTKPVFAAIVSSALFGLIHMNLVQFVYAFIIGLLLALVYEKFQNIWAPILFHFAANFTSITISNYSELENLMESEVVAIMVCVITSIAMIVLTYYFIKSKKVNGIKIELKQSVQLESQMEVQEKERKSYK